MTKIKENDQENDVFIHVVQNDRKFTKIFIFSHFSTHFYYNLIYFNGKKLTKKKSFYRKLKKVLKKSATTAIFNVWEIIREFTKQLCFYFHLKWTIFCCVRKYDIVLNSEIIKKGNYGKFPFCSKTKIPSKLFLS